MSQQEPTPVDSQPPPPTVEVVNTTTDVATQNDATSPPSPRNNTNTATATEKKEKKSKYLLVYKSPYGGQVLQNLDPHKTTVKEIKQTVQFKTGISAPKQKYSVGNPPQPMFEGVPDSTTLHQLGVLSGTFLHVTEVDYEKDNPDDLLCGVKVILQAVGIIKKDGATPSSQPNQNNNNSSSAALAVNEASQRDVELKDTTTVQ